jgi:hypothetical protein
MSTPTQTVRLLTGSTLAALLALTGLTGCAPSLTLRHGDPGIPTVRYEIDGRESGTLGIGDEARVRLSPGLHAVKLDGAAGAAGSEALNEQLLVHVGQGAVLTVLPREVASSSKPEPRK